MKYFKFLLLILTINAYGKDQVICLFNPEDCHFCQSGLSFLKLLSDDNPLFVVVSEKYKNNKEEINAIFKDINNQITYSDSEYVALREASKAEGSSIILRDINSLIIKHSFPITKILGNLNHLNDLFEKINYRDSINLPNRFAKYGRLIYDETSEDWVIISNFQKTSRIIFLNKTNSNNTLELNFSDSLQLQEWLKFLFKHDSTIRLSYNYYLQLTPKQKAYLPPFVNCNNLTTDKDTVYLSLEILKYTKIGENKKKEDIVNQDRNILILKCFQRKIISCASLENTSLRKIKREGIIMPFAKFYAGNCKLIFPTFYVSESYHKHKNLVTYSMNKSNQKLIYLGAMKYYLPSKFEQVICESINLGNYEITNKILVYSFLNEIYLLDQKLPIVLQGLKSADSTILKSGKFPFVIYGARYSTYPNAVDVVLKKNETYYVTTYSYSGNELFSRQLNSIPLKSHSIQVLSNKVIVYDKNTLKTLIFLL